MNRALALAERGGGSTAPNPMVGCVIADPDGRVLGEGFHLRAGEPHAEVLALAAAADAGHDVRGATVVVTLEPCAHQGRTPPCVDALVAAEVAYVAFGAEDPHTGKGGAARLAESGIPAEGGLRSREAALLLEPWLHFVRTGRPLFHLKNAITLNGRLTRGAGGRRWITGEEARRAVHRMRRQHAAVVIGVGTALADDPLLTVRDWPPANGPPGDPSPTPWPRFQPLRVVLDSRLRLSVDSRLARSAAETPVLVLCAEDADPARADALAEREVEVERVGSDQAGLDLREVAAALAARGVTGALVEPGPAVAGGFLAAGLADRWTLFIAPVWEGARDAIPLFPEGSLDAPFRLIDPVWERHGPDASVSGRLG
ncbi:MAG TPA: bifunctional diaminohydroxyphosphoribosylaminopyrimidine deaminase/5-amino-6-(5-phosphoribosylamino)uracil reductase RibD [Gemmatimonadota bacterium]|nr:bifunctional diaminohydroxyphosphoribosylaminopyrimidine deaminase/5-amino-6-(5-phosphoribosylamino)uracil reductase RibD [Gemmatimonadota bacterium]